MNDKMWKDYRRGRDEMLRATGLRTLVVEV